MLGRYNSLAVLALVLCAIIPMTSNGEYALVKKMKAETSEGLSITLSLRTPSIKYGEKIVISYNIDNRSSKTVYLVRENTSEAIVERDRILIPYPYVLIGGHEGYDYSFTKVERGRSYDGEFVISSDKYQKARPWPIEIGFGYITDITGLDRKLNPWEDPAPFKSLLNSRLQSISLSGLTVEIRDI